MQLVNRAWAPTVLVFAIFATWACSEDCASSKDCGQGETCVQGECKSFGNTDTDADADTDTDADADADADTDADTDTFEVTEEDRTLACSSDQGIPYGEYYFDIGPPSDIVPLCSGVVLIGDREKNRVVELSTATNKILRAFQLETAPGDLLGDPARNVVYVAQDPSVDLAVLDLQTGKSTSIELEAGALSLALGNQGYVFASLDDGEVWPDRQITVVDPVEAEIVNTFTGDYDILLAYDQPGDQLFVGGVGGSPSPITRCVFDPEQLTLTTAETRSDIGSNGQDLNISPDGSHLAFSCGSGNGNGYTIFDFNTDDLGTPWGEWNTDAYPTAAVFSPDGEHLVATNGSSIMVFTVDTHVLEVEHEFDWGECPYSSVNKVGISRGGRILYAIATCGFDDDSGKLAMFAFNP